MLTRGEYTNESGTYGVILSHTKLCTEAVLVQSGLVVSAYKSDDTGDYSFNNVKAKEMVQLVKAGVRGCTSKNGVPGPFVLGAITTHEFTKTKVDYMMQMFKGEVVGCLIESDTKRIELSYYEEKMQIPQGIKYVKLTSNSKDIKLEDDDLNNVPVRSVEEIMLEKEDVTWLRNKKYYIVNDDATAEQIFNYLDNYNGAIAYDTETTGLRINCFGKIGSEYQKTLIKYNEEHPNEQIRSDKLVGIIFCIENDVSYYFPCFNRKFKNLYDDKDSPIRKQIINNTKARYTLGQDLKYPRGDMYNYVMNTPDDEWSPDVILMERVRNILETKHIVAHNGAYEWKVDWMYEIDTNLKDDTMIMHQIMYKFRSTTSNRGESSSLKYLAKVELGIDQWELDDFFPDFKEDDSGLTRAGGKGRKKKGSKIDFSYMDYEGTRIYAPTDGDVTYQLFMKYKTDMLQNHKEQKYIYEVEMVVACAVAYMEFYGHRLDEEKILNIREQTRAKIVILESKIRQHIEYSSEKELELFKKLNDTLDEVSKAEDANDNALVKELMAQVTQLSIDLKKEMDESKEHPLNLASPSQVADLFYKSKEEGGLGYKFSGEKPSVAKKEIKALVQEKNEDGTPKNLVAVLYSDYKREDTLMTKFFDNLPYYMYPGGYIFSSYGQISTATGRMSCSKPNAQQYPKAITKIVAPRPGYVMIDADYSQIEYRVLTALAKNAGLAELFKNPDSDYHTLMASLMFEVDYAAVTKDMRSQAKSFNFGIPYGMGPGSLAILLTGRNTKQTRDEAIEKTAQYFKNQPNTKKFFENVKEQAQVNKYTRTLFNRYRFYSFEDKDGKVNNAKKAAALRQAGNAVIQGCLDGNTRIQTKEFGIMKIKDLVGYSGEVWDGEKWSHGDILYSGEKRKCIITFSNGQKFICSPTHKFLVKSHRGTERFVECQNLLTKENSKNPHRVVINKKYEASDLVYNSEWAYKYKSVTGNANNVFLEDIKDSFGIGVVLGRLASDGSVLNREIGASNILQYVAEHEKSIIPELGKYMDKLGCKYNTDIQRENRNESMNRIAVYSKSLTNEVTELDIKHKVHDNIFMDTELLRGFLRGFFDGDGGISGKTISLTFGTQFNFEEMCRDLQKALLFFGIRSRYYEYDYRYKLTIKTNDNQKFLDLIGFMNKDKQEEGRKLECVKDEHIFGPCLIPESVEITDEYIDMYDVCNTDGGYYVADGIITHNTAADIFKLSVARNFSYIRNNRLYGDFLIINMVHDEQLTEINVEKLNIQRIARDMMYNMQYDIEGFPPLFIGAGVGMNWAFAKGGDAEMHPMLLQQLADEADVIPIRKEVHDNTSPKDVVDYFQQRIKRFSREKLIAYLTNPENWHKAMHPANVSLLNDKFSGERASLGLGTAELTAENLKAFIAENNLEVQPEWFVASDNVAKDIEEDKEFDEDEDGELEEYDADYEFTVIDESDKVFGASLHDLISTFKIYVIKDKVVGIDTKDMYYKTKDAVVDYLSAHVCDDDDPNGMEIVFLTDANVLNRTGIKVKNLNIRELELRYKYQNKNMN